MTPGETTRRPEVEASTTVPESAAAEPNVGGAEIEVAVNNVPIDAEALPSKKSKNQMTREKKKRKKEAERAQQLQEEAEAEPAVRPAEAPGDTELGDTALGDLLLTVPADKADETAAGDDTQFVPAGTPPPRDDSCTAEPTPTAGGATAGALGQMTSGENTRRPEVEASTTVPESAAAEPNVGGAEIEEAVNNVPIDAEALPSKKSTNQMKRERKKKRKKQMIGECLYPLIAKIVGLSLAGEITVMLLEMPTAELLHLLESPGALEYNVRAALAVLSDDKETPSKGKGGKSGKGGKGQKGDTGTATSTQGAITQFAPIRGDELQELKFMMKQKG